MKIDYNWKQFNNISGSAALWESNPSGVIPLTLLGQQRGQHKCPDKLLQMCLSTYGDTSDTGVTVVAKASGKRRVSTERRLTELVEVRLDAVCPGHRADESGLQERAPLVHQTAVAPVVVLQGKATHTTGFYLHTHTLTNE